jgi:RNA polymerase sigma-70 factor (ECF subfamily)
VTSEEFELSGPSEEEWSPEGHHEELFRELFDLHFQPVCNFFGRKGLSFEDALDLAQETFLLAYRGMESFRGESSAKTWLFTIARRVWIDFLRRRGADKRDGVHVPVEHAEDAAPQALVSRARPAEDEPEPLELMLRKERMEELRAALAELPPKMRQCVMLRLFQGLKYREIAVVMRISGQTVKTYLFQAKNRLTALLEPYFSNFEL